MMSTLKLLSFTALAGAMVLPVGAAHAQDSDAEERAQDPNDPDYIDPRAPIVIKAWREERRQSDARWRANRDIVNQQVVGIVGDIGSNGSGSNPAKEAIDWQRLGLIWKGATNDPLARYSYAYGMARCAIASVGMEAADYVDLDWGGDFDTLQDVYKGRHRHCVNSAVRAAPAMMVNSALTEQLIVNYLSEPPLFAKGVDADVAEAFIRDGGSADDSDLATVGRCLAVFVPGFGYDLLFTTFGSEEEEASLEEIYKAAPECGVTEMPKKVDKVYQRAAIAMGLFRWYGLGNAERAAPQG